MSLPDWQFGRDNEQQSTFMFQNVTNSVADNKDTLYVIKPIDKCIFQLEHRYSYVICGQAGTIKRYYLIEKLFTKAVDLDHIA